MFIFKLGQTFELPEINGPGWAGDGVDRAAASAASARRGREDPGAVRGAGDAAEALGSERRTSGEGCKLAGHQVANCTLRQHVQISKSL